MGASNTPENLTARYAKRPTSTNLISIDRLVVIRARRDRVADRMLTNDLAGPTLREAHHGLQMHDGVTLGGRPYH